MLSRDEAAATLKNIRHTQGRSAEAYGYQAAAPFLILWGVIWFLGYGATDLYPHTANWAWGTLIVIGFLASAYLGRRGSTRADGARHGLKIMASWLALLAFIAAAFSVLRPTRDEQVGAFIPLLIAFAYSILGIWGGMRFLIAGVAVAVLTLGGFFLLEAHFSLWMAAVGGGTLVATGLWLNKA